MELEIVYLSPHDLTPYKGNTRKHGPEDIEQIKESIIADGFNDPIGIWGKNNLIVEGHGRQIAALDMGLEKVPCIRLDHMTDKQRRDYAIRHNRTAELSGWDFAKLEEEIAQLEIEGVDLSELGFEFESEEKKKKKERPEVEFSEILGEENNYLILQFKTDIDWLNACTVFGLGQVKSYSTRKDGVVTDKMQRIGTARVLDGAQAIRQLVGEV